MFTAGGPGFWELAEQALSSTERGYDLLAAKFDWTPFRTPDAIVLGTEQYLRAGPPPRSSIDLCCGTGVGLEMLRRMTLERLVGVDFSRNMLEQARRRLESVSAARGEPHPQLELIRGDVLELGDRTELHSRFDIATCFGALGHIREVDSGRFFGVCCVAWPREGAWFSSPSITRSPGTPHGCSPAHTTGSPTSETTCAARSSTCTT